MCRRMRSGAEPGCGDVRRRAEAKLAEIDQKLADLRHMRASLARLTTACPGRGGADAWGGNDMSLKLVLRCLARERQRTKSELQRLRRVPQTRSNLQASKRSTR